MNIFECKKKKWKSKNIRWALPAVQKTTQQDKLIEIALNAPLSAVRRTAIERITDQTFLKDRATNDLDRDVRKAAIEKITDQEFLKNRAINDSDIDICEVIWQKIIDFDQEFLKDVVIKAASRNVRKAAIEKITDQEFLKDRVINNYNRDIYEIAVKKITDQKILKEVVSTMGKTLRESSVPEKRHAADCLLLMYKQYKNNMIGNNIRKYSGTVIIDHSDIKIDHMDYYTGYSDNSSEVCHAGICSGYTDTLQHISYPDSDHSDTPAEYFEV